MTSNSNPRHGKVMLRRDLLRQGYDDRTIAVRIRSGAWVRVRHGAYADAAAWKALDTGGRHALLAQAVVAQAKTEVVISHGSALPFLRAPTWGVQLDVVHVTRTDGRAGRSEAGVRQHVGVVLPGDVVESDGLPVMSPTRVAVEITTVASVEASLCIVSHFLHSGQTTEAALQKQGEVMKQWPGTLSADLVLRLSDGRFESVGECRTYFLCFSQHLPMPVPQFEVRDGSGRVVARVDFAWPEFGVFLEFDGKVKYEKLLREGQRASDVVIAEKRREDLICRLTGWRCIRLDWADLAQPGRTAARIRQVLAQRRT